jgi:hypothetical protein
MPLKYYSEAFFFQAEAEFRVKQDIRMMKFLFGNTP